jgi:phage terminase small subunit
MPALKNPKHELFAHGIAKGMGQREAYLWAGYTGASNEAIDANASRLIRKDKVSGRIAEIQERMAIRSEETVERITADLRAIVAKGHDMAPTFGPPAAQLVRAALMDIAKLNGLVVEKTETRTVRARDMSDDELATIARGGGRIPDRKTVN